jgi:hypothetical protein
MIITSDRLITHDPTALLMTAGSTIDRQLLLAGAGVQKKKRALLSWQHTQHTAQHTAAHNTLHCSHDCWQHRTQAMLVHGCKTKQGLAAFLLAFMAAQTFHESTNNTLHIRALLVF